MGKDFPRDFVWCGVSKEGRAVFLPLAGTGWQAGGPTGSGWGIRPATIVNQ